jgi:hypothetical protein
MAANRVSQKATDKRHKKLETAEVEAHPKSAAQIIVLLGKAVCDGNGESVH